MGEMENTGKYFVSPSSIAMEIMWPLQGREIRAVRRSYRCNSLNILNLHVNSHLVIKNKYSD